MDSHYSIASRGISQPETQPATPRVNPRATEKNQITLNQSLRMPVFLPQRSLAAGQTLEILY